MGDFDRIGAGGITRREEDGAVIEINSEAGAAIGNNAIGDDDPYFSSEGGTGGDGSYVYVG